MCIKSYGVVLRFHNNYHTMQTSTFKEHLMYKIVLNIIIYIFIYLIIINSHFYPTVHMGLESSTRHCSHRTYHCSVPKGCPTSHQRDAAPSRIQNIVILEAWFLLAPTPFYCIYTASRIVWHCHCSISNRRRPMASPH